MIRSLPFAALLAAAASAALAQGPLGTVERGHYVCELPGDAAALPGVSQPERNFRIETGSRYVSSQGSGTYLRKGDRLQMTSGPRKGEVYQVVHSDLVRLLGPDGKVGRLRCVWMG